MPTAYLTTQGLKVLFTSERLEVSMPPDRDPGSLPRDAIPAPQRRWIPLCDVEHVVVDAGISFSTRSLCNLLHHGIPVLFLSHGRFPEGVALPFTASSTALGAQLDASRDPAFRLLQAKTLIDAKIHNQKRVLQRLSANRQQPSLTAKWLDAMRNQARAAASLDSLRGLEGASSGRYFENLNAFFPADMPFERRSRRPPHNPANALLSFAYTLLVSEITLHLRAIGLEPEWGVYHETEPRRPSLALDLLEPFRAPIADALALDLLNHQRLGPDDFIRQDNGWLLRRNSRKSLFAAYENRLEREFTYEQTGSRTTLRSIIKDQCQQIKKAFSSGKPIDPFIMN